VTRSSKARVITTLLAVGALVVGCEDRPAVVIEGERVAVAPYFDAPVCAGSVAEFDGMVKSVEHDSGLEGPRLTTFFWGPGAVEHGCSGSAFACARSEKAEVFGLLSSFRHEVAHVVGHRAGRGAAVVEEGFAISHETEKCASVDFSGPVSLRDYLDVTSDEIHASGGAAIGGHFAIYLGRLHGLKRWSELKVLVPPGSSIAELDDAFEVVYGMSLDDAERLWQAEAPHIMCPGQPEPALVWTGEPIVLAHDLDCDDVSTFGPLDQTISYFPSLTDDDILEVMYSRDRLLVPFVDRWAIDFDGPADARAFLRTRSCTASASSNPEQDRELRAGESVVFDIDACEHLILMAAPPDSPARVELRIARAPEGE